MSVLSQSLSIGCRWVIGVVQYYLTPEIQLFFLQMYRRYVLDQKKKLSRFTGQEAEAPELTVYTEVDTSTRQT